MEHGRELAPGSMVAGDWRIERMLGAGGFGVTYEARHRSTAAHVALKEYMPSGLCSRAVGSGHITAAQGPAGDFFKRGLHSFMKEAETLARLDHPSIVRVTRYFEANGTAYMALAFESGGNLSDWLNGLGRRPTQAELDRLLWPLSEALIQVHSLHLLHRDIKPDNIMLRPDGRPVLIDFGAVKQLVSSHSRTVNGPATLNVATDGYAPPEQYVADGEGLLGPWTDVYALAATLYQAVTGKPPPAAVHRTVDETYRPLAEGGIGDDGLRPQFLAGVDRALALKRSERPQSVVEFRRSIGIADIEAIAPSQPKREDPTLVAVPASQHVPSGGPIRPPVGPDVRHLEGTQGGVGIPVHLPQLPHSAPASASNRAPSDVPVGSFAGYSRNPGPIQALIEKLLIGGVALLVAIWIAKTGLRFISSTVSSTTQHSTPTPRIATTDPVAALTPGSGQSARDRLADGSPCAFCPEMVVVPRGTFRMGSPESEADRFGDEGPVREVTIGKPFAIGKFEVTFDEWRACVDGGGCASNRTPGDAGWGKGRRPVINVSWNDTQEFVTWLSRTTGKSYRLLTEAEWEYAARADTTTRFHFGDADARLGEFAWFTSNSGSKTQPVGQKTSNPWGLADMHGNVWEWVQDCYVDHYKDAPKDETVRATGDCSRRVVRGGSWNYAPWSLRSASRINGSTVNRLVNFGFRLARSVGP